MGSQRDMTEQLTHTHMHTGSEHVNTCLVNMKAEKGVMCLQVRKAKDHQQIMRTTREAQRRCSLTASEGITPANILISASASSSVR